MDNVLVLRIPYGQATKVNVPLTCGEAHENKPVFWKKNGEELKPALQGNQVNAVVEEMDGGNYTCHLSSDGQYLNHTIIMVQINPDNRAVILEGSLKAGYIHCSADNYKGSFHCKWQRTKHRSQASVLLVKADRYLETIPCDLDADGSGLHCRDVNCSYKEEQHHITLTVYIHNFFRLEAYTKTFYLREIVRPAKIPNLRRTADNMFQWDYPESWEEPCSYFGLQFHIKVVKKGELCTSPQSIKSTTIDETKYEVNLKTKKYSFCVQAQDKHTNGPWSTWSQCMVDQGTVTC
ncbi:interleukin-12 subunit beta [Aulostomus maculatus]